MRRRSRSHPARAARPREPHQRRPRRARRGGGVAAAVREESLTICTRGRTHSASASRARSGSSPPRTRLRRCARRAPALRPESSEGGPDLRSLVARYARRRGPFTTAQVRARSWTLSRICASFGARESFVRGELRPGGVEREWCDPDVLRRLRRASRSPRCGARWSPRAGGGARHAAHGPTRGCPAALAGWSRCRGSRFPSRSGSAASRLREAERLDVCALSGPARPALGPVSTAACTFFRSTRAAALGALVAPESPEHDAIRAALAGGALWDLGLEESLPALGRLVGRGDERPAGAAADGGARGLHAVCGASPAPARRR